MSARILSIDFHHKIFTTLGAETLRFTTIRRRNRAPSFLTDLLYIGSPAPRFSEITEPLGGQHVTE
jgi:hypothetical protein